MLVCISTACGQAVIGHEIVTLTPYIPISTVVIPTIVEGLMCTDGYVTASAWEDLDSDGIRDAGEPPLKGVCISADYKDFTNDDFPSICYEHKYENIYTDATGEWRSPGFMIGGCGTRSQLATEAVQQCQNIVFAAYPLSGYQTTTETTVIGCKADFGYKKLPNP
jgi:hypothetical protein